MKDTGTGKAFTALIHLALRAYKDDTKLAGLTRLVELQIVQAQQRAHPGLGDGHAVRAMLAAGLDSLAQVDREGADLLIRRFINGEAIAQAMRALHLSERALFKRQEATLSKLSQIIWTAEETTRLNAPLSAPQQDALAGLPAPSFSRLFGVNENLALLLAFLRTPDACWLVSVDGMGGIGKTALARAAAEELVCAGDFARVLWVTARQQFFAWGHIQDAARPVLTYTELLNELCRNLRLNLPATLSEHDREGQMRAVLAQQPTLIVLDNLETALDIQAVVTGLDRLARPTKVLLTTRHRVSSYENVTSLSVHELSREDALAFIHYHATERNVPAVLNAPLLDLERIIKVTGGSPLAIKLVIGQLHARPLAAVVTDLAAAQASAREFYLYIFRYSWARLSPDAQRLLLHLPLLDTRGAAWEELAAVSGFAPDAPFWQAIEELVACSLLNAGYMGGQIRYSIHRLTEHFILSDLVHL